MFIAVHSVAGGIAGERLGNPVLAFILGFILHFVLDAIPHEYSHDEEKMELKDWLILFLDLAITIFVWHKYYNTKLAIDSNFFWGAIGGIFPDLLDNIPIIKGYFRQSKFGKIFHKFHENIQRVIVGVFWGRVIEYVILVLLIWGF